jgi:peptide/nickel transport system permease protein
VLAFVLAAGWSRYLRGSMIETVHQPFIAAARARGVPASRIVMVHALRNALAPLIAIVTVDAALLVSGAVVTESVFAWPGLGSLFTEALARRDYTVLMALLMLSSVAVVVFNVAGDLLHAALDPRVAA